MYCSLLLYQTHKKGNKRPFSSVEKRCKSEKDVRSSKNTFVSIVSKMMVVEAGGSLVSSSINEVESYNAAVAVLPLREGRGVQRNVSCRPLQILSTVFAVCIPIIICFSITFIKSNLIFLPYYKLVFKIIGTIL